MASSRKSTSSKSYQEGPRKKPLRQRDHVEAQATVESDTSAQKRRFTPKSAVAGKSKTTTDSSKTQKVDSSKMKVTKKKATTEERERSDKKPFNKEHTPPDIQSTAPSSSSSSSGAAAAAASSTSQGSEKPGVSSSTNKSSESSVGSSGTVSTKNQSGDNVTTSSSSGTSTVKKSSSVSKSTAGATMKKSRMSQSESKKDSSSRERKMGVVSCGPINASKSEHKTTAKTKNAKAIPSDSTTSQPSSTSQPVSNTSDAKVSVVKKNCSTDPKNEPPKPLSGLLTSSPNDSINTGSTEHTFHSPDLSSSNGRLKRCLIQEQAFDECEEDSICMSDLNTSSSFSLSTTEVKKIEPVGDCAERMRNACLKFEPTSSLKPDSPVSTIQLSQSELQKQKREHHLRELQLADPSLSVKINLQKKLNLENSVCKDGVASNNTLSHPPIVRHSSSPAKVESSFQYRRSKDHLALVEVLRKFGLSHCIRFFSHDMTLAKFMTLTCDDILETYQVTNPLTRKQLQHVITQLKAEEDTDTEVELY